MAYGYGNSAAGIGAFSYGINSVAVYGSAYDPTSIGIQANHQNGGTAFSAQSTIVSTGIQVAQIQNSGTLGIGLGIQLTNSNTSATGLYITSSNSTTSYAIDATGKVALRNYANGILTVDGLGNLGVTTLTSGPSSGFLATSNTPQSGISSGVWITTQYATKVFDDANAFNTSTANGYSFIVPLGGVYQVNASVPFSNIGQVDIAIVVNGTSKIVNSVSTSPTSGIITSVPISGILKLTAGQIVNIQVRQFTGATQSTASSSTGANASFSMVKLY
jgi:hypothetical protein